MDTIKPDINVGEEPGDDPTPPSSDRSNEINTLSLKGYFNIESTNVEQEDALQYIYKTFSEGGINEMAEILHSIKDIEMRVGPTPLGESRLIHVKNYLKVLNQIGSLQKILETYER